MSVLEVDTNLISINVREARVGEAKVGGLRIVITWPFARILMMARGMLIALITLVLVETLKILSIGALISVVAVSMAFTAF